MKLQFGMLLLLIAISIFFQEIVGMTIIETLLALFLIYVVGFWIFNFFKRRALETAIKPEQYVKMNRIFASYARKGSKKQTEAQLAVVQGLIDQGKWKDAEALLDDVTGRISFHAESMQHQFAYLRGYIALAKKDVREAERALKKTPKDGKIRPEQKKEIAFVRALFYLMKKDKVNAESEIARLNDPRNNREQLLRLFAIGWLFNQKGDREKAAQAMDPILTHGKNLWFYEEAKTLQTAAKEGKEYRPWTSVSA